MPKRHCISSEALNAKNHAFGRTWGGRDATFHHNLLACNTGRNPSIGMSGEFDYRYNSDEVPIDSDHDGMPDAWEKKYQLNPHQADDSRLDSDGDGYTNVEEYLNGTNPRVKINYRNLGNNIDTISTPK